MGDYRILKALGEGGMGAVYLAEDTRLQRQVALKFLLPALAASEHGKVRFLREARAAARIKHENVVTVYEVDEVNGVPFIAMERLKGVSLDGWLRQKGTPPIPQTVRIVKEMLAGLQAAHDQGLVHRDIKPANAWLEAPKGKVRLLDFGLAVQPEGNERVTSTGVIMGTPAYMSPEQAEGKHVDHRSDLFSLGVVLYQLTTGRLPFIGSSQMAVLLSVCKDTPPPPAQVNPAVPGGLDQLIQQLLAKDPKARPQSAAEVIQTLSGPMATQSVASIPMPGPMEVPAPPSTGGFPLTPTVNPSQFGSGPTPAPLPQPVPAQPPVTVVFNAGTAPPPQTTPGGFDYTQTDDRKSRRDDDEDDYAFRPRRRRQGSDNAGVASLVLGIVSMLGVLLCCIGGHILAVPLAGIGLVTGFFGRGGYRVAGIILNGLALVPGTVAIIVFGISLNAVREWANAERGRGDVQATKKDNQSPSRGSTPIPDKTPGTLEVQFDDKYRQAGYLKYELFVDDKVQPISLYAATTSLSLSPGTHAVALKYNSKDIFSESVTVKPPSQGKTPLSIAWVEPSDTPGTLQIQYPEMPAPAWANVELFLDTKVTTCNGSFLKQEEFKLSPGKHTVRFEKNGVEVYNESITVKKAADGITYLKPNLLDLVSVNVTIKNVAPLNPGVEAYVEVDGKFLKAWPAQTDSVVFEVFVGTSRAIKVKTTKPQVATVAEFNVPVLPKKPLLLNIPIKK